MRVSVFGIGYVGAVSAACLAKDGHTVIAVDPSREKVRAIEEGRSPVIEAGLGDLVRDGVEAGRLRATTDAARAVAETDMTFICVGTPSLANGSIDLTQIVRACEDIGRAVAVKRRFHAVVVRSTMVPGSTEGVVTPVLANFSRGRPGREFGVAVYPEFLREGTALRDHYATEMVVLGSGDQRTLDMLREVVSCAPSRQVVMDPATAEMVKYTCNAWHATKIVFANEIGAVCKAVGVDGQRVMDAICTDTRLNISTAYMRPGFAFGGSCLPKDLRALTHKAKALDVQCPMIDALLLSNDTQIKRAVEMVQAAGNRRIGLLGLTFKPGTDDLRESPAVELAERLFGKGYDLKIYDRNVAYARLSGGNLAFIQARIPHLASLLTDDLEAVAAHGQTLVVTHSEIGDGKTLPPLSDDQVLVDLTHLPDVARPQRGRYMGIGW